MGELQKLLTELERQGAENDARQPERTKKMLNIEREFGAFLAVLVKATHAQHILEVGTSNGYSTLWLASALPVTGRITTVEHQFSKVELARANFDRAGMLDRITLTHCEANAFMSQQSRRFDMVFLDAERVEYMSYADSILHAVNDSGVLVADNAISHAGEMQQFMQHVSENPEFTTCVVPVGKGSFLAARDATTK